jgi:hypothetical protein
MDEVQVQKFSSYKLTIFIYLVIIHLFVYLWFIYFKSIWCAASGPDYMEWNIKVISE